MDYDEEADVLYLSFRRPQRAAESELRDDGVIVRWSAVRSKSALATSSQRKRSRGCPPRLLEDLLAAPRVDLVVLAEADPFLALDAIRGELLYCADPDAQAEQELYVLRRAGDLAPYERERRRLILGTTG